MSSKIKVNKNSLLFRLVGFLIVIPTLALFVIDPDFSNPIRNLIQFYSLAWGFILMFNNSKSENSMLNKSVKTNWIGIVIVITLAFVAFALPKYINNNSVTQKIKSIILSEKCVATINLKSGKTETIDIKSDVISKECKINPVVSKDGKYAAFDLSLVIQDLDSKMGKSTQNSSIVYSLDSDKWINVYNHGAGEATSISFNENNDLIINISYDGKDLEPWVVKNSDFEQILKVEEERVLGLVKKQKDVVNWLKNFDSKTYLSRSNDGKAVIQIDRHDGDFIIVHVYEQFSTDGHMATFNWFKVNRFTSETTKEVDY